MESYRLVTYASAAGPRAGIVIGDEVFDAGRVTAHAGDATVLGILDDWAAARDRLGNAAPSPGAGQKLVATRLLAPVRWPSAIYCAGANYADHAAEMGRLHDRPPVCQPGPPQRRDQVASRDPEPDRGLGAGRGGRQLLPGRGG